MVHVGGVQGGDTRLSLSSACATVRCRGMYICKNPSKGKSESTRSINGPAYERAYAQKKVSEYDQKIPQS